MDRKNIDDLYHNLRLLYAEGEESERCAIGGLVSHLTSDKGAGDYSGLLRFLWYYGETYLLDPAFNIIKKNLLNKPTRIVDFGAGLGWLGYGLSAKFGNVDVLAIDKRQWSRIDVLVDIESVIGNKHVQDQMREGDLVVMSELLHCLEDPIEALKPFLNRYPSLIIEYNPVLAPVYKESYDKQISILGCKPVNINSFITSLNIDAKLYPVGPYMIAYTKPKGRC